MTRIIDSIVRLARSGCFVLISALAIVGVSGCSFWESLRGDGFNDKSDLTATARSARHADKEPAEYSSLTTKGREIERDLQSAPSDSISH